MLEWVNAWGRRKRWTSLTTLTCRFKKHVNFLLWPTRLRKNDWLLTRVNSNSVRDGSRKQTTGEKCHTYGTFPHSLNLPFRGSYKELKISHSSLNKDFKRTYPPITKKDRGSPPSLEAGGLSSRMRMTQQLFPGRGVYILVLITWSMSVRFSHNDIVLKRPVVPQSCWSLQEDFFSANMFCRTVLKCSTRTQPSTNHVSACIICFVNSKAFKPSTLRCTFFPFDKKTPKTASTLQKPYWSCCLYNGMELSSGLKDLLLANERVSQSLISGIIKFLYNSTSIGSTAFPFFFNPLCPRMLLMLVQKGIGMANSPPPPPPFAYACWGIGNQTW